MLKKSKIWITIGDKHKKAYQEGIQERAVAPVCVVLDDVQAETDGGGHRQGQLGGGAGDAPGLGHGHDVRPGVERVAVPTQAGVLQGREGEHNIEHVQRLVPVLASEVLWSHYSQAGILTV